MAKRTKTQKKRLVSSIVLKGKELYMEGILSTKDIEAIDRIAQKAFNKLK